MATIAAGDGFHLPANLTNTGVPAARNGRDVVRLDPTAATSEVVDIVGLIQSGYGGGTIDLRLRCSTDEVSGDFDFEAQVERGTGLDLDTDSFDTANASPNNTSPATAGQEFEVVVTLTNADSLVAGDLFRVRVTLLNTSGATNPLDLVLWELREQ